MSRPVLICTSMKPFLLALSWALLCVVSGARADNKYAGQFVGFAYHGDRVVAGINFTVAEDGSVLGRGTYLDFTEINLTGSVSSTGLLTINETDQGSDPYSYDAQFTPNAKKFVARFNNGDVTRAKRVSGNLPQAGVYYLRDDDGEDGVLLINRAGVVFGVIYVSYYDSINLNGSADSQVLNATDDDGVVYAASFNDISSFSGTYDGGDDFFGNIVGSKY